MSSGTGYYVDCSHHNGLPDLDAYRAAGHTELMLKATEGTGYAWALMQDLARKWHSFGPQYRVGYYHWLYGTISGSAQFEWFWRHVGTVFRRGDWLMTDFEDVDPSRWVSDARHLAVLREFDTLAERHGPVHDYAPDWYLASLPLCRAWLRGRLVVASDYSHRPALNRYGLTFVAQQFTDRRRVAGFLGPVDYNVWLIPPAAGGIAGPTEIGTDDEMTPDDWAKLQEMLNNAITSTVNHMHADLAGTMARVLADQPEIIGLRQALRDTACALAGQLGALPDGTKITSIGAAHAVEMSALDRLAKQLGDLAGRLDALSGSVPAADIDAIRAAIKADIAAEFESLTLTTTIGAKA